MIFILKIHMQYVIGFAYLRNNTAYFGKRRLV